MNSRDPCIPCGGEGCYFCGGTGLFTESMKGTDDEKNYPPNSEKARYHQS